MSLVDLRLLRHRDRLVVAEDPGAVVDRLAGVVLVPGLHAQQVLLELRRQLSASSVSSSGAKTPRVPSDAAAAGVDGRVAARDREVVARHHHAPAEVALLVAGERDRVLDRGRPLDSVHRARELVLLQLVEHLLRDHGLGAEHEHVGLLVLAERLPDRGGDRVLAHGQHGVAGARGPRRGRHRELAPGPPSRAPRRWTGFARAAEKKRSIAAARSNGSSPSISAVLKPSGRAVSCADPDHLGVLRQVRALRLQPVEHVFGHRRAGRSPSVSRIGAPIGRPASTEAAMRR